MNNTIITILTIIGIISDLVELTYEAGAFTRKYIIPALIMAYVVTEYYGKKAYDKMTSLEMDISIPAPVNTNALGFG